MRMVLQNSVWATKLLASAVVALTLMVVAQRLAVRAYWEVHPEEQLKAATQQPLVERALVKLADSQKAQHRHEERLTEFLKNLEAMVESKGLSLEVPKPGTNEAEDLWNQHLQMSKELFEPKPPKPLLKDLSLVVEQGK